MTSASLLEIRGLRTQFHTEEGIVRAVDGVDLDVRPAEVIGLVGESGSGKSVTALSILRLVPSPPGRIVAGTIRFRDRDLLRLAWPEMRTIRGRDISMVFQEPMTSLNPVLTIGRQVMEVFQTHDRCTVAEARERSEDMLARVGLPEPRARMTQFPHQLSGGMRQRVVIAIALALDPALLIADEPTTALDVTIQAQILDLMLEKRARHAGGGSMLLITHNLAVVAETCDRVAVMYGGRIQEIAPVHELFRHPAHPYTRGLLAALPRVDGPRARRLPTIDRAALASGSDAPLVDLGGGHWVRPHSEGVRG